MLFKEYLKYYIPEQNEIDFILTLNHSVNITLSFSFGNSLVMMCSKEDFLADGFTIAFYIPRMNLLVYKISDFLNHINNFIVPILVNRTKSYAERAERMDAFRESFFKTSDDRDVFREEYWKKLNEVTKEYPLIDCAVFNNLCSKRLEKIKAFYS